MLNEPIKKMIAEALREALAQQGQRSTENDRETAARLRKDIDTLADHGDRLERLLNEATNTVQKLMLMVEELSKAAGVKAADQEKIVKFPSPTIASGGGVHG